jgi:hypothetical protein
VLGLQHVLRVGSGASRGRMGRDQRGNRHAGQREGANELLVAEHVLAFPPGPPVAVLM